MAPSHASESLDAAFQVAVASFAANLTDRQRREFKGCSLKEVEDTIKDVETRLASQRKQRNMQRLSSFLEGMNQLGKVIEVFVNCDSTVAFIWGPIKFVLLMIGTWVETLDCLLDTYVEIGEFLSSLPQYESLLAKYPGIGVHLHRYYCDVLEFHRNALSVFSRPSWEIFFHSAWKTFRTKFGPILTKLKRHRDLLSGEKLAATVTGVHQSVQYIEEKVDMLSRQLERLHCVDSDEVSRRHSEDLDRKRQFILAKLDPPDYHYELEKAFNERQTSNSGDWLLADTTFDQWADMTKMDSRTLYLNGIPGSGKTILASRVVHHLRHVRESTNLIDNSCRFMVLYFFFKHSQPKKSNFTAMLRSLLSQTLFQDEVLLDLVYQRCARFDQQKITSISLLRELLIQVLQAQRTCFIVVDALDECTGDQTAKPRDVQGQIIDWLESLERDGSSGASSERCVRLLISGQRNGVLDDRLRHWPTIQLESSVAHKIDIDSYCEVQSHRVRQEFDTVEGIEDIRLDIVRRVSSRAKGMFLYAKVVLNNLLDQPTSAHFERELQEENFPHGLDQAYERVAAHVLESDLEKRHGLARRILNLIICAERPLRWKEIQSRFSIEIQLGTADPKLRLLKPAKYHCGSLVEISRKNEDEAHPTGFGPDDSLELVHETARTYLLQTRRFHLTTLHSDMALFCAQYLYSAPFDPSTHHSVIKTHSMTGYYGFLEYAAANWWKHAKQMEASEREVILRPILGLMGHLNPQYQLGPDATNKHITDLWTQVRQLPNDSRDWEHKFPSQTRIQLVRTYFDALLGQENTESPADIKKLHDFYGRLSYKCCKPWCDFFQDGFKSTTERDDHVNQHDLPFRCSNDACHRLKIGFARESELFKHNQRLHTEAISIDFPSKRRGNIFKEAAQGHLDVLQDLIAHGASVNARDKNGLTPLFLAVRAGKCDVCRWLLERGAEVDARCTKQSLTPLHAAVTNDDVEIALLLIADYGADIYAFTSSGDGMRALMERERCFQVREAFPSEFWNPDLSTQIPHSNGPAKQIQEDFQVIFNADITPVLDVDLLHTLEHDSAVNCVTFSCNGKYIATCCNREAHIYNAATGDRIQVFREEGVGDADDSIYVWSVCFSPDGKYLVTGAENKLLKVWDIQNIRLHTTFSGHFEAVYSVDGSRDGRTIASGSGDKTVRIWDLETRSCQNVLDVAGGVARVAISPNTELVAACSLDKRARVWNTQTGCLLYDLGGHGDSLFGMSFSPDGLKLASCSLDQTIKMWDLSPSGQTAPNQGILLGDGQCIRTFEGHKNFVLSAAFTPDSRWMISGAKDRCVRFWDPQTGDTQLTIEGHTSSVISVASSPLVTPLGGLFLTSSGAKTAHIWSYTYLNST